MGLCDHFQDSSDEFEEVHRGYVSYELLGGAVAYEAAKGYEEHCKTNGKPDSYAKAKELLATLSGAALVHLVETKGLDAWDTHKRRQALTYAEKELSNAVVEQYE